MVNCEADRASALVVLKGFRGIELLPHVVGHGLVELRLTLAQFVRDRIGDPLGEQRRGVELEKVLFHHPAHEVGHIRRMGLVAEFPLKPIAIQRRHEQLEASRRRAETDVRRDWFAEFKELAGER